MSDVLAVFGSLILLAVTLPAMLVALWLFFPATVARARRRVDTTPGRCLSLGVLATVVLAVPIGVLLAVPAGPVRLAGFLSIVALLVVSLVGQAGIAAALAVRMMGRTDRPLSPIIAFLTGTLTLELASGLPIVGWFLVTPIVIVTGLGAAIFALFRREAKLERQPTYQPVRQPAGQPTGKPMRQPTGKPMRQPAGQPTGQPERQLAPSPASQAASAGAHVGAGAQGSSA